MLEIKCAYFNKDQMLTNRLQGRVAGVNVKKVNEEAYNLASEADVAKAPIVS